MATTGAKAKPGKTVAAKAKVKAGADAPAADEGGAAAGTLKMKALVERVAEATGRKKRDVRDVAEALLKTLGEALHAGETLALPAFGKVKVSRQKDLESGEMLVLRLRRKDATEGAKAKAAESLAEPAE